MIRLTNLKVSCSRFPASYTLATHVRYIESIYLPEFLSAPIYIISLQTKLDRLLLPERCCGSVVIIGFFLVPSPLPIHMCQGLSSNAVLFKEHFWIPHNSVLPLVLEIPLDLYFSFVSEFIIICGFQSEIQEAEGFLRDAADIILEGQREKKVGTSSNCKTEVRIKVIVCLFYI